HKKKERNKLSYYQDWLKYYEKIQENNVINVSDYEILSNGEMIDAEFSLQNFVQETNKFLENMISARLVATQKEIQKLLEFNDYSNMKNVISKLENDFKNLTFYKGLNFISDTIKTQYDNSIKKIFNSFVDAVKNSISKNYSASEQETEIDYLKTKILKKM
ncbi:MAG: hypothetical protein RRZ69_05825, partial [Clostridia bacterium]